MKSRSKPPRLVLGLAGRAGVGKSTIARALVDEYRDRFDPPGEMADSGLVLPVGAPLKAMMAALYYAAGLPPAEAARRVDGDLKRSPDPVLLGRTPTEAMQTLGTEWGRECIAPDLWVAIWRRRAEAALPLVGLVVNDSVRFANETAAIHALGGVVVRLVGRASDIPADHPSEAGAPADFEAPNTAPPREVAARILDAALTRAA